MTAPQVKVRRASLDDLAGLRALWQSSPTALAQAEPRLTDFQVIEGENGPLLAATGLQIAGTQARVHTEAFLDRDRADELRPHLWERLLSVANNHGLTRLWTLEKGGFWEAKEFVPATPEALKSFPPIFGSPDQPWQTLQLRQEVVARLSIEQELALFRDSQRESTEKMFRRARVIKTVALIIVAVLFVLIAAGAALLFRKSRRGGLGPPRSRGNVR